MPYVRQFIYEFTSTECKHHPHTVQVHVNITEKIVGLTNSREFRSRWQAERALMESKSGGGIAFIKDSIARAMPIQQVMRMLCLQSAAATDHRNGLPLPPLPAQSGFTPRQALPSGPVHVRPTSRPSPARSSLAHTLFRSRSPVA